MASSQGVTHGRDPHDNGKQSRTVGPNRVFQVERNGVFVLAKDVVLGPLRILTKPLREQYFGDRAYRTVCKECELPKRHAPGCSFSDTNNSKSKRSKLSKKLTEFWSGTTAGSTEVSSQIAEVHSHFNARDSASIPAVSDKSSASEKDQQEQQRGGAQDGSQVKNANEESNIVSQETSPTVNNLFEEPIYGTTQSEHPEFKNVGTNFEDEENVHEDDLQEGDNQENADTDDTANDGLWRFSVDGKSPETYFDAVVRVYITPHVKKGDKGEKMFYNHRLKEEKVHIKDLHSTLFSVPIPTPELMLKDPDLSIYALDPCAWAFAKCTGILSSRT